jgi:hypothetical protein
MRRDRLFLSLAFLGIAGCASKLVIYSANENPNEVKGIRVRAPASYVVTKEIETQKCPTRTEDSIIHLPVGEAYDITFDPAPFGKAEFAVSFSDTGVLRQISLNSTPQVAETIKAVAELTEKVSEFVPLGIKAPDCGSVTSSRIVSVKRLTLTE